MKNYVLSLIIIIIAYFLCNYMTEIILKEDLTTIKQDTIP
jgi:hypothetical protein